MTSKMAAAQRLQLRLGASATRCRFATESVRSAQITRRFYAKGKDERGPSFKGQLYNSVSDRIEREKAEEERFAQHREVQRMAKGGTQWLLPACRSRVAKLCAIVR